MRNSSTFILAEIAGSGMMKIFDNWRAAGYMPPVIRNNEPTHWFTIEFSEKVLELKDEAAGPPDTTHKSTQKMTKKKTKKRTQKQQAILDYLEEHPDVSIRDISLNVEGVTENGVKSIIKALRRKGLLKHVGPDKSGHWEVIEDNNIRNGFSYQGSTTKKSTQKPAQKTTKKSTQKTTQKQRTILAYLKNQPGASIKEISLNVEGVTQNGVKSILLALKQKGLLKRVGPDKGGYWEVVGMGEW